MEPSARRALLEFRVLRANNNFIRFEHVFEGEPWADLLSLFVHLHPSLTDLFYERLNEYQFKFNLSVQVELEKEGANGLTVRRPWFVTKAVRVLTNDDVENALNDAYAILEKKVSALYPRFPYALADP